MSDNLTSSSASATMHTYLLYKDGETWKKLVDIKDYPSLGGSPEQIETTTLSNEKSTFVNGVQSMPTFEFLSNYTLDDFDKLSTLQASAQVYEFALAFGKPTGTDSSYGSLGSWSWKGQLAVWVEGGGVNAAREMRTSISVTEEPVFSKTPITVAA